MREIVSIQLGQCGNLIGTKFWEHLADEVGITNAGVSRRASLRSSEQCKIYFEESPRKQLLPRTVLVDSDRTSLDLVRASAYGQLFNSDYFVFSETSTGGNWASGRYTEGVEIANITTDAIRSIVENTDCFQGFQLVHSLGGGTGSGTGSLILMKLMDQYPGRMFSTFSILPSMKPTSLGMETYNAVLGLDRMTSGLAHTIFCFDNDALTKICEKRLAIESPTASDLNHIAATAISSVTAYFRYPEVTLNSDMRRMYMNMVPFKGLGLLTTSSVPISSRGVSVDRSDKPYDLIGQVLDSKNSPFGCDYWRGRFMACCALFRGTLTPDKATSYVTAVQEKHWSSFASTFTQGIQTTYVSQPPHGLKTSASVVANTTAVRQPLGNLLKTFRAMFKQRVLLHYYLGEGLEEAEFRTAEHRLSALVTLYLKQHGKSKAHTGQDFGGSDEDDQ